MQVVLSPHASPLPWTSRDTKEDCDISKRFGVEEGARIAEEINDDITAGDTIELRSALAVDEEVVKTVQQLTNDFESCIAYLSESPDDDVSLPDVGNQPLLDGLCVNLGLKRRINPWIRGLLR